MKTLQFSLANTCLLIVLAIMAQAGCVTMDQFHVTSKPTGVPSKMVAFWIHDVMKAIDPVNAGAQLPGLAGRVYFMDKNEGAHGSILVEGKIVVAVYDERPSLKGEDPTKHPALVTCTYEKAILKEFERHDPMGWGYTLFVPWPHYDPKITHFVVKTWFERPGALPLYANDEHIKLGSIVIENADLAHKQSPQLQFRQLGPSTLNSPTPATDVSPGQQGPAAPASTGLQVAPPTAANTQTQAPVNMPAMSTAGSMAQVPGGAANYQQMTAAPGTGANYQQMGAVPGANANYQQMNAAPGTGTNYQQMAQPATAAPNFPQMSAVGQNSQARVDRQGNATITYSPPPPRLGAMGAPNGYQIQSSTIPIGQTGTAPQAGAPQQ